MNYKTFKTVMSITKQMVEINCSNEEVRDFLIKRKLVLTNSQIDQLVSQVK